MVQGGRLGGDLVRPGQKGKVASGGFVGFCDGLKGYIFDYGAASHPELYCKSKEAMLDYIRVPRPGGNVPYQTS